MQMKYQTNVAARTQSKTTVILASDCGNAQNAICYVAVAFQSNTSVRRDAYGGDADKIMSLTYSVTIDYQDIGV